MKLSCSDSLTLIPAMMHLWIVRFQSYLTDEENINWADALIPHWAVSGSTPLSSQTEPAKGMTIRAINIHVIVQNRARNV